MKNIEYLYREDFSIFSKNDDGLFINSSISHESTNSWPLETLLVIGFKQCLESDFEVLRKKHAIELQYTGWACRPDGHGGSKGGSKNEFFDKFPDLQKVYDLEIPSENIQNVLDSLDDYANDYPLKDDQYLLKVMDSDQPIASGFMTKLTKKGSIPVLFDEWGRTDHIRVISETFRRGWRIDPYSMREGKSQNWVRLIHPFNFVVEVHAVKFMELISIGFFKISDGELIGRFKWEYSKLIKEVK